MLERFGEIMVKPKKTLQEKMIEVYNHIYEAVVIVDENGIIDSVNNAAYELFGFAQHDCAGRSIELILPKNHNEDFIRYFSAKVKSPNISSVLNRQVDVSAKTNFGTNIIVELTLTKIQQNSSQWYIAIFRDISSRKKYEAEMFRMHAMLREKVDIQTKDLMLARDQALAAERSMSTFLTNMSHEFRTPLHGIISFSRFGLKKIAKVSNEKLGTYFQEIYDSADQLLNLVNNLLDLSKLKAGKVVYDYSDINAYDTIISVVSEFQTIFMEKNIKLDLVCSDKQQHYYFDKIKLSQVVRNLISNAYKFSDASTVISVDMDTSKSETFVITICDQGMDVPADELETIFDTFAQSSNTSTQAGGTGLGLSICKEIVEHGHLGVIRAKRRSDVTSGVCFKVTLQNMKNVTDFYSSREQVLNR